MKNQTWAVLFTNDIGDFHELKFVWHEHPSHEEAAARIVQQHCAGQQQREIIDIARIDLMSKQAQMEYFGYKISYITGPI